MSGVPVVADGENVTHQLVVGHVDRFADTACVLSAIMMLRKLQVIIEFPALGERLVALGAFDEATLVRAHLSEWVHDCRLLHFLFQSCDSVSAADEALPICLRISSHA